MFGKSKEVMFAKFEVLGALCVMSDSHLMFYIIRFAGQKNA